MGEGPQLPADWTGTERWVWDRIAAGKIADLNERDRKSRPDASDLDPTMEDGWADRRLSAAFLRVILTDMRFVEATPFGGVRILGALVDDEPIDLEHARLGQLFWLEKSRVLVPTMARDLRVDGQLSFEASLLSAGVELYAAKIAEGLSFSGSTVVGLVGLGGAEVKGWGLLNKATFEAELDLTSASLGGLDMSGSTFKRPVSLNSSAVTGVTFLRRGATFEAELDLSHASLAGVEMTGSAFNGTVSMSSAKVAGTALLDGGATFGAELNLTSASLGGLSMRGSTLARQPEQRRREGHRVHARRVDLRGGA